MDLLTQIFSHVCGQGRCLVIDGTAMPVCLRCMGLYVGAALTGVWIVLSGIRRKGLPSWSVFLVDTVVMLCALVGGCHLVEGGVLWKLTCGLWTGHVVSLWLVGARVQLRTLRTGRPQIPWTLSDKIQGLAFVAVMPLLGVGFGYLGFLGWWTWAVLICIGAALLLGSVLFALVSAARFSLCRLPDSAKTRRPVLRDCIDFNDPKA